MKQQAVANQNLPWMIWMKPFTLFRPPLGNTVGATPSLFTKILQSTLLFCTTLRWHRLTKEKIIAMANQFLEELKIAGDTDYAGLTAFFSNQSRQVHRQRNLTIPTVECSTGGTPLGPIRKTRTGIRSFHLCLFLIPGLFCQQLLLLQQYRIRRKPRSCRTPAVVVLVPSLVHLLWFHPPLDNHSREIQKISRKKCWNKTRINGTCTTGMPSRGWDVGLSDSTSSSSSSSI